MTTCVIHQAECLPYLGFFDKIRNADIFILLDDCEFTANNFQNRNKIRSNNKSGFSWLTIPIKKNQSHKSLYEIEINNNIEWKKKWLNMIKTNYSSAPNFKDMYNGIKFILDSNSNYLIDYNISFIYFFMKQLNIKVKLIMPSSAINLKTVGSQRLLDICVATGTDTYLSGIGGKDYLDLNIFQNKNINVEFSEFEHPIYKQQFKPFQKNMGTLDYLMNLENKNE